jgi:hypothetical protein
MGKALTTNQASRTRVIPVETGRDLLTILSPFSGLLPGRRWYRGQKREDFELIPTALRRGGLIYPDDNSLDWTNAHQIFHEIGYLMKFAKACDRQGLAIPEGLHTVEYAVSRFRSSYSGELLWPPNEVLPALSLAQHHGVPTRLLDWTSNPFIACYFAAAGSLEDTEERDKKAAEEGDDAGGTLSGIAVWVYDPHIKVLQENHHVQEQCGIRLTTPEYAYNANLKAQEGMLMYESVVHGWESPARNAPLDRIISNELDGKQLSAPPVFIKFVLPGGEAPHLLVDLDRMGISSTTLFPGYYGAAKQALLQMTPSYFEMEALHGDLVAASTEDRFRAIREQVRETLSPWQ